MKKVLALSFVALTLGATVAEARDRFRGGSHGYHRAPVGRHYAPPVRYHQHRSNVLPWVAGGAALGILGAGAYYYNQNYCRWERREVFDQWGNFRGYRDVRVCD